MKKLLMILLAPVMLSACYMGPQGELVGVQKRQYWDQSNPYGMNYIHFGSYTMGPSDQDVPFALNTRSKTVTIPPFYMDVHEISNNEYRQFVHYVRDSLFLQTLADNDDDRYFVAENAKGQSSTASSTRASCSTGKNPSIGKTRTCSICCTTSSTSKGRTSSTIAVSWTRGSSTTVNTG